ncbi:MAG: hypothetical protein KDD94_02200 [Calditrichaeota bacterium]|nr:hypothetical protein [Calditrichota bacterium]
MGKVHTTNYYNTFIEIAEDCPLIQGEVPPLKGDKRSVANQQFDLLSQNPYRYSSDDILFMIFAERNGIASAEQAEARQQFFAKGQPCFRSSPLAKRYAWGVHYDADGKMAIYPAGSDEYERYSADPSLTQIKAMRSKRA